MAGSRAFPVRTVAAVTAGALALLPTAALAADHAPKEPLTPRDSANSVAQSVQIRTNADGEQNAAVNFRWSATQITAYGEPNTTLTVQVPERGASLHNLQNLGFISQENGMGQFEVPLNDKGVGVARSVSLFPQDEPLPVELTTEFTLDGQPITAAELRGKSGTVTAKYTVTNRTTKDTKVTFDSVSGDEVEKTVEADVPYVVEATSLLPFTWANLNTGSGLAGADGRGNWLTKWIALPFRPLSADGSASFGWSANVQNVQLPSLLIQASPVYIPPAEEGGADEPAEAAAAAGAKAGVPPPNISGDVESIKAGFAQVASGLEQLTSGGGEDPLDKLQDSLNTFFQNFGADIQNVSSLLDPNNEEGVTAQLGSLISLLDDVLAGLDKAEAALPALEQADDALTADQAQAIADASGPIKALADRAAGMSDAAVKGTCKAAGAAQDVPLTEEQCLQIFSVLKSSQFQTAAAALAEIGPKLPQVDATLATLATQLPGTINTLQAIVPSLQEALKSLQSSLADLSASMATIAQGLQATNVDLPTMDQVVSEVVASVLASPGGQDLTAGMAQVSEGLGGVKSELSSWVAQMVVAISDAAAKAKEAIESGAASAQAALDRVDTLVASVHGIVVAAGTSPLPYGGNPEDAPEGTKLAGAYEFRVDAADTEAPSTLPRILIALLLLLVGGFIGARLLKRPAPAGAAAGGAAGAAAAGGAAGASPAGWASHSDQHGWAAPAVAAGGAAAGAAAAGAADSTQETAAFEPISGDATLPESAPGAAEAAGAAGAAGSGAAAAAEGAQAEAADQAAGAADQAADAADAAAGAADQASDAAAGSADAAAGGASEASDAAAGAADQASDAAADASAQATDAADSAADEAKRAGGDLPEGPPSTTG